MTSAEDQLLYPVTNYCGEGSSTTTRSPATTAPRHIPDGGVSAQSPLEQLHNLLLPVHSGGDDRLSQVKRVRDEHRASVHSHLEPAGHSFHGHGHVPGRTAQYDLKDTESGYSRTHRITCSQTHKTKRTPGNSPFPATHST